MVDSFAATKVVQASTSHAHSFNLDPFRGAKASSSLILLSLSQCHCKSFREKYSFYTSKAREWVSLVAKAIHLWNYWDLLFWQDSSHQFHSIICFWNFTERALRRVILWRVILAKQVLYLPRSFYPFCNFWTGRVIAKSRWVWRFGFVKWAPLFWRREVQPVVCTSKEM